MYIAIANVFPKKRRSIFINIFFTLCKESIAIIKCSIGTIVHFRLGLLLHTFLCSTCDFILSIAKERKL